MKKTYRISDITNNMEISSNIKSLAEARKIALDYSKKCGLRTEVYYYDKEYNVIVRAIYIDGVKYK